MKIESLEISKNASSSQNENQEEITLPLSEMNPEDLIKYTKDTNENKITTFHRLAAEANEELFLKFLNKAPVSVINEVLPKIVTVNSRKHNKLCSVTGLHIILNRQSFKSISILLKLIDSNVLYDCLNYKNDDNPQAAPLWRKLIDCNSIILKSKSKKRTSEVVKKCLDDFLMLIDNCKNLADNKLLEFSYEKTSKLSTELAIRYQERDNNAHKGWCLWNFICAASANDPSNKKELTKDKFKAAKKFQAELALKLIKNITQKTIDFLSNYTCINEEFHISNTLDNNILHYSLYYLREDVVFELCMKVGPKVLNNWITGRLKFEAKYNKMKMKEWSCLQMMLVYSSKDLLELALDLCDPLAINAAMQKSNDADCKINYLELLKKNLKLKKYVSLPKPQMYNNNFLMQAPLLQDKKIIPWSRLDRTILINKFHGIALFCELYHYLKHPTLLKQHGSGHLDLSERNKNVSNFLTLISNNLTGNNLQEEIYKFNKSDKPARSNRGFFKVIVHLNIRSFNEIMQDLCDNKEVSAQTLKFAFEKCRELFEDYLHTAVESPKKQVRFAL